MQYRKSGVDRKAKDTVLIKSQKTNYFNFSKYLKTIEYGWFSGNFFGSAAQNVLSEGFVWNILKRSGFILAKMPSLFS